jgi:rRNA biogenesis protein RRP5
VSAFLKTAEAEEYCKARNGGRPLQVGQLIDCAVTAKPKGRIVPIEVGLEAYAKSTVTTKLSMETLKPGMQVNTLFEKKNVNGIAVSFLEVFNGTITSQHLEKGHLGKDDFKPKQKIRARVLFVDLVNKQIALTTLPHLMAWRPFTFSQNFTVGAVLKDCKVTRLLGKKGLFIQTKGAQGFVKVFRDLSFNIFFSTFFNFLFNP